MLCSGRPILGRRSAARVLVMTTSQTLELTEEGKGATSVPPWLSQIAVRATFPCSKAGDVGME
jgi:hypothetical protein